MSYSICITNFNERPYIERSLQSITDFAGKIGAEVVVVDSLSTDGSGEVLDDYLQRGLIQRVIWKRCSRGTGRDIAFRNSHGDIVIASIDTDVVYSVPGLMQVAADYLSKRMGKLFAVYGAMIGTRSCIERIGGWRDLDRHEDNEISLRAMNAGLYDQDMSINVVREHLSESSSLTLIESMKLTYTDYRDWYRIGLKLRSTPMNALIKPHVLLSYVSARIHGVTSYPGFDQYIAKLKETECENSMQR
ncbi:MAG: glycosyltransferase family 2 protein [Candidatus Thermoplasmatota archaeon]|nr:glycosyltransferase family 2 protein [Candidatus Thermoplasmatota archaeon]